MAPIHRGKVCLMVRAIFTAHLALRLSTSSRPLGPRCGTPPEKLVTDARELSLGPHGPGACSALLPGPLRKSCRTGRRAGRLRFIAVRRHFLWPTGGVCRDQASKSPGCSCGDRSYSGLGGAGRAGGAGQGVVGQAGPRYADCPNLPAHQWGKEREHMFLFNSKRFYNV